MALLIRLIMALFTRPEIGLFHPTLTSVDKQMTLEIVESAINAHTDAVQKVDGLDQKAA